ncbi:MAG: hypothetical protein HY909_16105 [Deltaproteobacteria bacterium]|nr:hypothetical protein [Deltaproteobacteria bacterium]
MKHRPGTVAVIALLAAGVWGEAPAQPRPTPPRADAGPAAPAPAPAPAAATVRATFDAEAVGGPSQDFEAVVGDWYVAEADGQRGLRVDGARWRQGTPSVSLADQARRLYGERYAEFLDGVRAFAFFPLAVHRGPLWTGNYRMSVRFYPQAGRIDQAAGISFGIAPDGSYQNVRANALEDNILYAQVVRGRRRIMDTIRNVPTPTRTWHTLVVTVRGRHLTVELDGVRRHERDLDAPPVGRVGLWSKADSQVLFDDFEVRPAP